MKKTTITSIIAAAFSLVIFEAAQAAEESKTEDWKSGSLAGDNTEGKDANLIKVGAHDCPGGCPGHDQGPEQQREAQFPEGAAERIGVPEEN